ncbi:MAG TPA: hypothetical protein VIV40_12455 [Kofleriaceae bacterium]
MASTNAIKRTRGPNKQTPWSRTAEHGLSVLRLALDTSDPVQRRRIEDMFSAAFSIRRALQGDARNRTRAFWAARHERERDPAAVRARVGLSRHSLEDAAYAHVDGAPHLRRSITKALAMHLADSVWTATERHLFRDARGERQGMPRVGRWYDFHRLPGRARSHTTARKWETFRLHGTLAGHRAEYSGYDGRFFQPRRMRPVAAPSSWWNHDGPLAIVFSGLADGSLVLPVRLPAARSNQPILDYHLSDPERWHKIDLVRHRDPNAAGGWRYEAHLMVLVTPYVAPAVATRREAAAIATSDRNAGIDVNVSNITVASHEGSSDLRITRVERDATQKQRSGRHARQLRRQQRALERSRRASNRDQYQLSKRQDKRARRRLAAGLPVPQVIPMGPRVSRGGGKPQQAYRKDQLSATYRRGRASQVKCAASIAQARSDHARQVAGSLVAEHGYQHTVEDCDLRTWSRLWGRSVAAFSPGVLLSAIGREAAAVARIARAVGGVFRASTRTTALSQHCLCGERVEKTLAERTHACDACGLRGDRDAIAATLAACVVFGDRSCAASARLDVDVSRALRAEPSTHSLLHRTFDYSLWGRQDVPTESNAHSLRDGFSAAEKGPTSDADVVMARRNVGTASWPNPHETGVRYQTTAERSRTRTNLTGKGSAHAPPLRDSS